MVSSCRSRTTRRSCGRSSQPTKTVKSTPSRTSVPSWPTSSPSRMNERAEMLPSGKGRKWNNRVGWAATYLYRSGLLERPRRSVYRITGRGRQVLAQHPERVDNDVLAEFEEFRQFRFSAPSSDDSGSPGPSPIVTPSTPAVGLTRRQRSASTQPTRNSARPSPLSSSIASWSKSRLSSSAWLWTSLVRWGTDAASSSGEVGTKGSTALSTRIGWDWTASLSRRSAGRTPSDVPQCRGSSRWARGDQGCLHHDLDVLIRRDGLRRAGSGSSHPHRRPAAC
jgi:hypothetical protein